MSGCVSARTVVAASFLLALTACGSSSSGPGGSTIPPELTTGLVRVSATTPFTGSCNGVTQSGTLYLNAEVEPRVAVNPSNPNNVIGVWQQDRWSNGGAQGLMAAASFDGGKSWKHGVLPVSHCAGATSYQRASDPWVTFSPNGTAYAIALSFDSSQSIANAIMVTRSTDGGSTWSAPTPVREESILSVFNDKESITADPLDSNYVYAVWDRLDGSQTGPAYLARTTDAGQTWQASAPIYDPGAGSQTLNNVIHVLPDGTLVDTFSEIYTATDQLYTNLRLIRSTDHGATWSGPTTIAADSAMGVSDPESKVPVRDSSLMADVAEGPNGNLYVVWQDSRFSAYDHDGIAFSMSTDGGQTWSTPTEVNGDPDVQAFTPSVSVRADGTIGVTYYDFRYNDAAASLPTAYWLTESTDGIHWSEKRIAGPFDLTYAPRVDDSTLASQNPPEFFLGDYQGLAAQGSSFLPFFVKTNSGNTANRTDVWARPGASVTRTVQAFHVARAAPAVAIDASARARLSANAARALRSRAHHIAIPEQP